MFKYVLYHLRGGRGGWGRAASAMTGEWDRSLNVHNVDRHCVVSFVCCLFVVFVVCVCVCVCFGGRVWAFLPQSRTLLVLVPSYPVCTTLKPAYSANKNKV